MIKILPCTLLLLIFMACTSDAPKQRPQPAEPFVIEGSAVDPSTNSLIVSIKLDPPFTEETVKKAAEIIVERNKDRFSNITIRSYTKHLSEAPMPFAVSQFDGSRVTHQLTPQVVPQKIPSH